MSGPIAIMTMTYQNSILHHLQERYGGMAAGLASTVHRKIHDHHRRDFEIFPPFRVEKRCVCVFASAARVELELLVQASIIAFVISHACPYLPSDVEVAVAGLQIG